MTDDLARNLERDRCAAIWAMTPADHLDAAIRARTHGDHWQEITAELLFALVKSTLGEPRFENEGTGS